MAENTPLLWGTPQDTQDGRISRNLDLDIASVNTHVSVMRPQTAPPIRGYVGMDDSDEELFQSYGRPRPKTSMGYGTDGDEDRIGRHLNRQRNGGTEDEVLLNGDSNQSKDGGKSKIMNIVLVNIIMIIWSIAEHMHSPVYSQYLYRRIMEEVFGNSSLPSNHSQLNTTECFKPSPNKTDDPNDAYSLQEKAQQMTSEMNMKLSLCSYAFCFFSTLLFGAYSDYFGRKMLFLIPLFGHLVDYIAVTLIIYWNLDIRFFFVTSTLTGICTSEIFTIACYVYVADNTPPKSSRTVGLAVISVTESLTSAALSTGVGYYIQLEGYVLPSMTAAAILILAIVAVICILPEKKKVPEDSVSRKKKQQEKANLNPLKAIRNVFSFYFFDGSFKTRGMFLLCLAAYFVHEIALKMGNINTLWQMNYPLCWSPEMMGYYGTGSSFFHELIKIPLLKTLQCCLNDELIAVWSNIVYTGSLVLKSFSTDNIMMYGVAFMSAFDISVTTVVKAITSRMAGPDRLGALFASFGVVSILCDLLGTPAFSELYKYTLNLFRGTSYLVSAGIQCICTVLLIVFAVLTKMGYNTDKEVIYMKDNEASIQQKDSPTEDAKV